MRIYIGSDHAGWRLKARLLSRLAELGHEVVDCGPFELRDSDDYPPYCLLVGTKVVADPGSLGIVIGGSGNGEAIAANKVPGVRCALAFSEETAKLGREHNNANVLSLGARMYDEDAAVGFAEAFVATPFSDAQRHVHRIDLIAEYEKTGELPPRREDATPAP
ncbi:MAG TPA: ribose-5-phosphate isomerase [Mycobacteriales bacterium]|nr:ribose-5-phosphate isomerase [Mycobacteriales bacterium]